MFWFSLLRRFFRICLNCSIDFCLTLMSHWFIFYTFFTTVWTDTGVMVEVVSFWGAEMKVLCQKRFGRLCFVFAAVPTNMNFLKIFGRLLSSIFKTFESSIFDFWLEAFFFELRIRFSNFSCGHLLLSRFDFRFLPGWIPMSSKWCKTLHAKHTKKWQEGVWSYFSESLFPC